MKSDNIARMQAIVGPGVNSKSKAEIVKIAMF